MIKLDTTTRKIQAVLSGAVTANQLPCTVSYSDDNGTTYVGGTQLTNTNSTTAVDICAAPGASTVRDIDYLSIRNRDTAAATVTVMLDDNGTDYEIVKATLAVGDQLVYTHSDGWRALDANGNAKTSLSGATESQVQNSTLITLTAVSGTDTITAGAPDPFTAYADGQEFSFIAAGTNTGAATLNIDSVGAIDIKKNGGTALSAGDITSGAFIKVKYVSATGDFEMMGGAGGGGVSLSANNTWTGLQTFGGANDYIVIGDNATASNNLQVKSDGAGGGSICNGAGTELLKVPAGGVPAFRAYATGVTSVTSSIVKIALAGESYDTASAFDSTTNYRFAPLVAGYYQINGAISFTTASYNVLAMIYRGGSSHSRGVLSVGTSAVVSDLIYLDGTGAGANGYVELYGYSATTQNTDVTNSTYTYFSGILIKAT